MEKILFIAYYFPPLGGAGVQRSLKYVKYFPECGLESVVISSHGIYGSLKDKSMTGEIPENTKVYYLPAYSILNFKKNIKNKFFIKIINFIYKLYIPDGLFFWYFCNRVKVFEILKKEKIKLVYTTSFPYSAHLFGIYLKKKIKNIRWIADFRDEWAENPEKFAKKNIFKINLVKNFFDGFLEKKTIEYADKVISVSSYIENNFKKRYGKYASKFETITNGYDESDFIKNKTEKKEYKYFQILYYGSLYGIRHPFYFLEAFSKFIKSLNKDDEKKVKLRFVGNIDRLDDFKSYCRTKNILNYIAFQSNLPHNLLLKEAGNCSLLLLLIPDGKGQNGVFTGKIFEYVRLNVPILAMVPEKGEAGKLIRSSKTGVVVGFDDVEKATSELNNYFLKWKKNELFSGYKKGKKWEMVRQFERKRLSMKLGVVIKSVFSSKDRHI